VVCILGPSNIRCHVGAKRKPATLSNHPAPSVVGDVTIATEVSLWLGFICARSNEVADVLIRIKRSRTVCNLVCHPAGCFGTATIRRTEHDFWCAQLIGESGKMKPDLQLVTTAG